MSQDAAGQAGPFELDNLPETLAGEFERYWQRFDEACREADLADLVLAAGRRTELPRVWVASEFVANACIRQPVLLETLLNEGWLDDPVDVTGWAATLRRELLACENEAQLEHRLRVVRRREMVRLAWRDLGGAGDLAETLAGVSALAEVCIDTALERHHQWLMQRFGTPRNEGGEPVGMVVLALGKLGGGELNYSSDIDLLFAYDGGGDTDGERSISNQEYFIKLGRKLVSALDRVTADGFVFRTDMRLRPNGDSGPLVLPFSAMEHYYQAHGRDWERYALIKGRVVAGDRDAGQRLLALINPFVYRKYLDFGAFESIREMKQLIERELEKKSMQDNVKLGQGGIREIEFLVQSHQLIRGGRERALQTPSLYRAAAMLEELGVLEGEARATLIRGYEFLRNTEHRLQMVHDRQTQQLPEGVEDRARLAWSMGSSDWEAWRERLDHHRRCVHEMFGQILGGTGEDPADSATPLRDVWLDVVDDSVALEALRGAGYREPDAVLQLLREFRRGRLYQAFSGIDRDRIDRLIPLALDVGGRGENARRALSAFVSVIESIGRRSVYLSLLIENPFALRQLMTLCAASPWISRHIGRHPVVMDELLSPLVDVRKHSAAQIEEELDHRLEQGEADDEEQRLNIFREFNHAQVLRVAAADVSGVLEPLDVCTALTRLAEVILERLFADALDTVSKKLGLPPATAGIIAYGKFGTAELGYHSDLDIVVCYDIGGGSGTPGTQIEYYYSRVAQRLVHLLTTRTVAGQLYELDMRLRPSGNSGTLVTSLAGFLDYQQRDAWTWEHQALVRARAVVGECEFTAAFENARGQVLARQRDTATLRQEISAMRTKMISANAGSTATEYDIKLDRGGIVDIEFIVQYLVLAHAATHGEIMTPRTTLTQLEALAMAGLLAPDDASVLRETYLVYLRASLDDKLMERPVRVPMDRLVTERESVKAIWERTFG